MKVRKEHAQCKSGLASRPVSFPCNRAIAAAAAAALIVGSLVFGWSRGSETAPEGIDPRALVPTVNVKYIVTCATEFQLQASVDFQNAIENFRAESAFQFVTKHPAFQEMPLAWEYFFTASEAITGNVNGPFYVVGYYNPFLDMVLLTRWTINAENHARIVAASVRSGAEFSGDRVGDGPPVPRWMASDNPMPVALRRQRAAMMHAFIERFPARTQTNWETYGATSEEVLERLMVMGSATMLQLYAFQNRVNPAVVQMLTDFRSALFDGDASALAAFLSEQTAITAEEAAALPDQFRQEMVALYATGSGENAVLVMADPKLLRFCAVLTYRMTPPGKILSFSVFDMAAEERAPDNTTTQERTDR